MALQPYEHSEIAHGFDPEFPIEELKAADWNPRTIDPGAKKVLAQNLHKFGMLEFVVADWETKTILHGHQRVSQLKEDGEQTVAVIFLETDEATQKQINLALNNPHIEGEHDTEKLGKVQELLVGTEEYETMELGLIGTGTIRREETTTEKAGGTVESDEYLKVFRLHFLPAEWGFFQDKAKQIMAEHNLENYSELVLWLARNYAV